MARAGVDRMHEGAAKLHVADDRRRWGQELGEDLNE